MSCALFTLCVPMVVIAQKTDSKSVSSHQVASGSKLILFESSDKIAISENKIVVGGDNHNIGWTDRDKSSSTSALGGVMSPKQYYQMAWDSKNSQFNAINPNAQIVGYLPDGKLMRTLTTLTRASFNSKNFSITYTTTKPINSNDKTLQNNVYILKNAQIIIATFDPFYKYK